MFKRENYIKQHTYPYAYEYTQCVHCNIAFVTTEIVISEAGGCSYT